MHVSVALREIPHSAVQLWLADCLETRIESSPKTVLAAQTRNDRKRRWFMLSVGNLSDRFHFISLGEATHQAEPLPCVSRTDEAIS